MAKTVGPETKSRANQEKSSRTPGKAARPLRTSRRTAATTKPAGGALERLPPAREPTPQARRGLVRRLWRAINLKLTRLEERMASGEPLTPADDERETRSIGQLVRNFEMVTGLHADPDKSGTASPNSAPETQSAPDAERMRREIAERLERLHSKRSADSGSQ